MKPGNIYSETVALIAVVILTWLGTGVGHAGQSPSQEPQPQALIQQDLMRLQQTPQTGDQITAITDAMPLKGEVLRVEGEGVYLIEPFPGRKVRVRVNEHTKMPENFLPMPGDWIEAQITPDLHASMMQRSSPAYTMEGDLLDVEGNLFVVVDASGKQVSLRLSPDTKIKGKSKVGDWIRVEFTPDRKAVSVAPTKISRGPVGG
jgi:hypothetical protein